MELKKGMLATLSDGKSYIIMLTMELNNIKYIYLVENENFDNIKFCTEEIENDMIKLTEVDDIDLKQTLLREFAKKFERELTELNF